MTETGITGNAFYIDGLVVNRGAGYRGRRIEGGRY